jgi:hypothetical protein
MRDALVLGGRQPVCHWHELHHALSERIAELGRILNGLIASLQKKSAATLSGH